LRGRTLGLSVIEYATVYAAVDDTPTYEAGAPQAGPARKDTWLWIALGTVLVALGAASLGFAFGNERYEPEPPLSGDIPTEIGKDLRERFPPPRRCAGCADTAPWYAAGGVLLVLAVFPFATATRRR